MDHSQRQLTIWGDLPFIAVGIVFIAAQLLTPGLIGSILFAIMIVTLGLSGIALMIAHAIIQVRSGESGFMAFLPVAVILVSIGTTFHQHIFVIGTGLLSYASMDSFERGEGVRFAIANDGRFHPRVRIDGASVDFVVDTATADIVLTPDDARRIGIDPSSLSFDQEIKTASGMERAAGVHVRRIEIGSITIEDVPAKVTSGNTSGNVLGMAFFDRLSEWEVWGDQLMIIQ